MDEMPEPVFRSAASSELRLAGRQAARTGAA